MVQPLWSRASLHFVTSSMYNVFSDGTAVAQLLQYDCSCQDVVQQSTSMSFNRYRYGRRAVLSMPLANPSNLVLTVRFGLGVPQRRESLSSAASSNPSTVVDISFKALSRSFTTVRSRSGRPIKLAKCEQHQCLKAIPVVPIIGSWAAALACGSNPCLDRSKSLRRLPTEDVKGIERQCGVHGGISNPRLFCAKPLRPKENTSAARRSIKQIHLPGEEKFRIATST